MEATIAQRIREGSALTADEVAKSTMKTAAALERALEAAGAEPVGTLDGARQWRACDIYKAAFGHDWDDAFGPTDPEAA